MLFLKTNNKRSKFVIKSFSISFFARLMGLVFTVLITPMLINYLGKEDYGLWSILISFSSFLAFSDFGLGAGLLNFILLNKNDKVKTQLGVFSTFYFLLTTSLLLIILLISLSYLINWNDFFNTDYNKTNNLIRSVIFLFLFNIPFSIIQKIQFGFLENYIFHVWEVVQKIFLIVFIFISVYFELDLINICIGYYLIFILINILNLIYYEVTNKHLKFIELFNKRPQINKDVFSKIFKFGYLFFFMNITFVIGMSTNKIIIAYWGSIDMVTDYDILLKPFEFIMVFVMMFTSSLWPAFGDAIISKDLDWIQKVMNKSILIIIFSVILITTIMVLFGNDILNLWLGNIYIYDYKYFILFGVWTFVLSISNLYSALLNASNYLKFQIITFLSYGIISFFFKVYGLTNFGLFGFILFNTIAYLIAILLPNFFIYKRIKNEIY